jgi:alpha-tubulin suppressor-like RCC1 family protein/type II secretory pathway pseudopilin PulG
MTFSAPPCYRPRFTAGYTLLELSIVISIIAAVIGASLVMGNVQLEMMKHRGTRDNLETVQQALELYRSKYKRYPCPAALNGTGTAYGQEIIGCATMAAASCPAGLTCLGNLPNRAVIGGVPFRALGLPDEVTLDKWNSRLLYALDANHAVSSTSNAGSLRLVDGTNTQLLRSPYFGEAIYVLLSHGPNRAGAYTNNGQVASVCSLGGLDQENCDLSNAVFRTMPKAQGTTTARTFDDEVIWKTQDWGNVFASDASTGTSRVLTPPKSAVSPVFNTPYGVSTSRVATWWLSSCAINRARQLYCWGSDDWQRIGDGGSGTTSVGTVDKNAMQVGAFSDWTSISTFLYSSCGVRSNGIGYCWGAQGSSASGNTGALGNGTDNGIVSSPGQVATYTDWVDIRTSWVSCGLRQNGQIYCWGDNGAGMLGNGTSTGTASTPQLLHGLTGAADAFSDWANVDLWNHACAVRTNGLGYCWGTSNAQGQLGIGSTGVGPTRPTLVGGGITNWKKIIAGPNHSCGSTQTGRAYCWGRNAEGQLGDGTLTQRLLPTEVAGRYLDWSLVDAGDGFTCGLRTGEAWCWGNSSNGRLGLGSLPTECTSNLPNQECRTPQKVAGGILDWVSLDSGFDHTCGVRSDGTVWCWGQGSDLQLGNGMSGSATTPIQATTFVSP